MVGGWVLVGRVVSLVCLLGGGGKGGRGEGGMGVWGHEGLAGVGTL